MFSKLNISVKMTNFISPAGNNQSSSSILSEFDDNGFYGRTENHPKNSSYQDQLNDIDSDVAAAGSTSSGQAAHPQPSERSSTLDAKDAKLSYDEGANGFSFPCQSESTDSSSAHALMVTGTMWNKKRIQPPPQPANSENKAPPPLPPRTPLVPVPPRTYKKTSGHATPSTTPSSEQEPCGPPLPPRLYLLEREEAEGLQILADENVPAGNTGWPTSETHFSQEEEHPNLLEVVPSAKLTSTVLYPKQHANTAPSNLNLYRGENTTKSCDSCLKWKKILVNEIMKKSCSESNLQKDKVVRRHSK